MRQSLRAAACIAASACIAAAAAQAPAAANKTTAKGAAPSAPPDLAALIECRKEMPDFLALQPAVRDPRTALALGWKPLPQVNPFMSEFALTEPIKVFGLSLIHI